MTESLKLCMAYGGWAARFALNAHSLCVWYTCVTVGMAPACSVVYNAFACNTTCVEVPVSAPVPLVFRWRYTVET